MTVAVAVVGVVVVEDSFLVRRGSPESVDTLIMT